MKEAYNKFSKDKIIDICNQQNINYIKHYWNMEKEETMVVFTCDKHIKFGVQEKRLYDIQRQKVACPYCNHSKLKYTYKDDIAEIHPNIEILSDYINWDTPILCRCRIDGNEWKARISSLFRSSYMCKECRKRVGNSKRKTLEAFKLEMAQINDSIEIVDDKYLGTHEPIKCKCKIHLIEWESRPCNLINKTATCPVCAKENMRDVENLGQDAFIKRVAESNPNVEVVGEYINTKTPIEFKCLIHNHYFYAQPRNFLYRGGKGCPYCSQSTGETKMINILKGKGFNIQQQYSFDDCRHINKLRFDGYDIDNGIAYEYQGQQHYRPVDFTGQDDGRAEKEYEMTIKRDNIKEEYCRANKIPLIKVPYWELNNMENYIDSEIKKISI